jgi:hypothetical protein
MASLACPAGRASSCGLVTPAAYLWVDPRKEVVAVYMAQAPSPIRAYYRKMFKSLVYQALVN